jgi:RNA polymerase sigma-70 factor, ECF subfamily
VEDKEVILKIRRGEIDSYYHIVEKYTQRIYNYVYKTLFDKSDVDDIVQEVFLNFYKAVNRFDVNKKISPYLIQIAKNQLKMYFRSKKTHLPLKEEMIVEDKPDNNTDSSEMILKQFPADQKKAMELFIEGFSYNEIASKLKKPLNTVKTIIRRSRLKVSHLKKYYQD